MSGIHRVAEKQGEQSVGFKGVGNGLIALIF